MMKKKNMKKLILTIIGSLVKQFISFTFSRINKNNEDIYLCKRITSSHCTYYQLAESFNEIYDFKKCSLFLIFQSFVLSPNIFANLGVVLSCMKIYQWIPTSWPIWWSVWKKIAQQCYTVVSLSPRVFFLFSFFTQYLIVLIKNGLKERILCLLIKN